MKVPISDIVLADDINIRRDLREETVEHYTEILDDLPPISITEVAGKKLLTDGWHRLSAATRLGRTEIEAEITAGDRTEAMVAAIVANTKHGLPLSTEERDEGIVRLSRAGWGPSRIARTLGLQQPRVSSILQREELRDQLGHRLTDNLTPVRVEEIARAPREYRVPVAEATVASGWSQQQTREVARQLADPAISEDDKRRIVQSQLVQREDGQVGVSASLVSSMLKDAKARAASPAIYGFTAAAAELLGKLKVDPDPLDGLNPDEYPGILRGLDDAELAVAKVRRLIVEARP